MSGNCGGGNQWKRRWAQPPGGPSVRPGRTGAAWTRCRRIVIASANGLCQICGGALNPNAARWADDSTEVDHHPTPLWRLEEIHGAGTEEFARAANDPNNARAVHRRCHKAGRPLDSVPVEPRPVHDTTISIG